MNELPPIIAVSNPTPDSWVKQAYAEAPKFARKYGLDPLDFAQEAVLSGWRSGGPDSPENSIRWVRVVLRNTAISLWRRRSSVRLFPELDTSVIDDTRPEDSACERERAAFVVDAIKAGKQMDREVLEAFYFDGKSLKDMAKEFGVPIGTIKRRLHVARLRLGRVLCDKIE